MENLFLNVLEASFYGCILILAVCAFRVVFRKVPKAAVCLLWLLVGIRLICPFQIESDLSLQPASPVERVREQGYQAMEEIQTNVLPNVNGGAQNISGEKEPDVEQNSPLAQESPVDSTLPADLSGINTDLVEAQTEINWVEAASIVWMAGMGVMVVYTAMSWLKLKGRVKDAIPAGENIFVCPGLDSAFVLGVIRPKIYLPEELDEASREFVLAHERGHIVRGDHISKFAAFLVLAVHWFNPLVWLSYVLLCRDLEMACDERVVKNMALAQRKAYSTALLACAAKRSGMAFCPVAFGEVGVKERIVNVLRYRKPGFWMSLVAIVAVVIAAVCFLTSPAGESGPSEPSDPAETTAPVETTEPSIWQGVDEATAAYLTEQFTDPTSWYYMALCDDYISPEFMSPTIFFEAVTEGEKVFFTEADYDTIGADSWSRTVMDASCYKLDNTQANGILDAVFGITMADFRSPDNLALSIAYYEELDSWGMASSWLWWQAGDTENSVEILGGQLLDNGDIAITYTDGRKCPRVVTVRNVDGVWKVRSNLMVSDVEAYSTDYSTRELPWELPETMSYEEYFSQRRAYTQNDQYGWSGTGWLSDYNIECDGCRLVVRKNNVNGGVNANLNSEIVWVIPSDVDFSQCNIRFETEQYLIGVKGNEIFRVDYYGNYETLFADETGMLAREYLAPNGSWWTALMMDQTIWFVAGVGGGEPHPGIYRMYVPTGQVDLIYDDFPSYESGVDENGWGLPAQVQVAYSNYEMAWSRENEAFWALYYDMVDDTSSVLYTDEKYQGYSLTQEAYPSMILAEELDVDPVIACFYNEATGEYAQEVIGRVSSNLTYDEIYWERLKWWEE